MVVKVLKVAASSTLSSTLSPLSPKSSTFPLSSSTHNSNKPYKSITMNVISIFTLSHDNIVIVLFDLELLLHVESLPDFTPISKYH